MPRALLSVVAGLAVAFALVFVTDALFHAVFATGQAPDEAGDAEAMRAYVAAQPVAGLAAIVVGWAIAAFAGAATASRLARRGPWPGYVVTGLFLMATGANFLMVAHPRAMVVGAIAAIALAGWLGTRTGRGSTRSPQSS
jgi:hypothetical protein